MSELPADKIKSYCGNSQALQLSPGAGMLLGMAVGDSYGSIFENLSGDKIEGMLQISNLIPGSYTDDTQQALAIAELMISNFPFTPITLSNYLLMAYHRDKRKGYSDLTQRMLDNSPDADSFLKAIPENEKILRKSDGAAMRALPIGFFNKREEMISSALKCAIITHGHPHACAATVAIACIAHERYHKKTPFKEIWREIRHDVQQVSPDIIQYCDKCAHLTRFRKDVILEEFASYGVPYTDIRIFLGAVISLLNFFGEDPVKVFYQALLLGGDTDTSAAIVLGSSLIHNNVSDQMKQLIIGLEDGRYGRTYLQKTGDLLSLRFPQNKLLRN